MRVVCCSNSSRDWYKLNIHHHLFTSKLKCLHHSLILNYCSFNQHKILFCPYASRLPLAFFMFLSFYLFLSSPSVPVSRGKTCIIQGRMQDCYCSQYGGVVGPCSADLTVILVMTESIHHSEACNAKHILPQPDQSQASWTTKCLVMPYFDHIIGEQLRLTKHSSDFFFPSLPASLSFFLPLFLPPCVFGL